MGNGKCFPKNRDGKGTLFRVLTPLFSDYYCCSWHPRNRDGTETLFTHHCFLTNIAAVGILRIGIGPKPFLGS